MWLTLFRSTKGHWGRDSCFSWLLGCLGNCRESGNRYLESRDGITSHMLWNGKQDSNVGQGHDKEGWEEAWWPVAQLGQPSERVCLRTGVLCHCLCTLERTKRVYQGSAVSGGSCYGAHEECRWCHCTPRNGQGSGRQWAMRLNDWGLPGSSLWDLAAVRSILPIQSCLMVNSLGKGSGTFRWYRQRHEIGRGKGPWGGGILWTLWHTARKWQSQNLLTSKNRDATMRLPEHVSGRNVCPNC